MRKKIIAGNWKMNYCVNKAEDFVNEIKDAINTDEVDVVICPNFVALDRLSDLLDGTNIKLGAQNVYFEDKGAYTGETSVCMLASVGVNYCIVGHSERRQDQRETPEEIQKKVKALITHGIKPILCVGETEEERKEGLVKEILLQEINSAMEGLTGDEQSRIIIAYEPIWSIGTGKIPTNEDIEDVVSYIKDLVQDRFGKRVAVLYGGSVNMKNVETLNTIEVVDGYLIGGASTKPEEFKFIMEKCE
jgi:triosephosphate isomerase